MKDKVLVTGASGFVGGHIVERLLTDGFEVSCTIRSSSQTLLLDQLGIQKRQVSWNDSLSVEQAVSQVDYVIHCAGVTTALNYDAYYQGNVAPTLELLRAIKKVNLKLKGFIFISTQASAGPSENSTPKTESDSCNPVSDYGKTKLEAEKIVLDFKNDFPVTILRPCSIYGPRDQEFYSLFKLTKNHLTLLIGDGTKQVNMIFVKDFVESIVKTIEFSHPSGSIYFSTDGEIYSWKTLYETAQKVYNKKTLTVKLPIIIPKVLGWINDRIANITSKPVLLNSQKVKEMMPQYWLCDSSKIQKELHFKPAYSLQEGFQETLSWYLANKML